MDDIIGRVRRGLQPSAPPSPAALSLPRMSWMTHDARMAIASLTDRPIGVFAIDPETDGLYQLQQDGWEQIGQYFAGSPSDDPFANQIIGANRAAGIGVGTVGGGGATPAPTNSAVGVTDPQFPFPPECGPVVQNSDPGAVGPGVIWLNSGNNTVFVRNSTDTGWIQMCLL